MARRGATQTEEVRENPNEMEETHKNAITTYYKVL